VVRPGRARVPSGLGIEAHVESPCFASGEPIRIEIGPEGVRSVKPAEAVVSVVSPAANPSNFREALCHEQHFFSSPQTASRWQTAHPEGIVVSVADAFTLTRRLSARWFQAAAQDEDGPSLEAA
jgi:alkylmercury lyase